MRAGSSRPFRRVIGNGSVPGIGLFDSRAVGTNRRFIRRGGATLAFHKYRYWRAVIRMSRAAAVRFLSVQPFPLQSSVLLEHPPGPPGSFSPSAHFASAISSSSDSLALSPRSARVALCFSALFALDSSHSPFSFRYFYEHRILPGPSGALARFSTATERNSPRQSDVD